MSAPDWRWATGPDDQPGPGEFVARLRRVGGRTETYPGAGRVGPRLTVDLATGEATATTPAAGPSDLVLNRSRIVLTVTAGDGRELVARFDLDADAPLIPEDADDDLRDALRRAWRDRPPLGRRPNQAARIAAIVTAAADLPEGADTRATVAAVLGRVRREDGAPTAEPSSAYKADVTAAGGWGEVRRRAREIRATR